MSTTLLGQHCELELNKSSDSSSTVWLDAVLVKQPGDEETARQNANAGHDMCSKMASCMTCAVVMQRSGAVVHHSAHVQHVSAWVSLLWLPPATYGHQDPSSNQAGFFA